VDELAAEMKAREFIRSVNPTIIPVPIEAYVAKAGATLRVEYDLDANESGCTIKKGDKHIICVNGNESRRRQRFTACHEIAHIVLGLPSDHGGGPSWSYAKRSPNEICCDVFAAELLFPYQLFRPFVEKAEIGLASISDLADKFDASDLATGSRFATLASAPCAFVLSEQGIVRYASRSRALREARAWISPRSVLPANSVSARARAGELYDGPEEAPADIWFNDWNRGGVILEDARHISQWDQTMTLLWFDDEEVPREPNGHRDEEEEVGLKELDGTLPWPGKSKRRK
jgi:Zn-dependent peptidase ImmA (M78 family)